MAPLRRLSSPFSEVADGAHNGDWTRKQNGCSPPLQIARDLEDETLDEAEDSRADMGKSASSSNGESLGLLVEVLQESAMKPLYRVLTLTRPQWQYYQHRMNELGYHARAAWTEVPGSQPDFKKPSRTTGHRPFLSCLFPIISPRSRFAHFWISFVMLCDLTYASFLVPVAVAFCEQRPGVVDWCQGTEIAFGLVYLCNLYFGFTIGYVLVCGHKHLRLMHHRLIARVYVLHGSFWADSLTVIPWLYLMLASANIISNRATLGYARLMLALRMVRIIPMLKQLLLSAYSNPGNVTHIIPTTSAASLYSITLAYVAALVVNFYACFIYTLAKFEGKGIANSWLSRYDTAFGSHYVKGPKYRQYVLSLYWIITTMTTVGYGDVVAVTPAEQIAMVVVMLSGALVFGILVSSISEALSQVSAQYRRSQLLRTKLADVRGWLRRRGVDMQLRGIILAWYSGSWQQDQELSTEAEILADLPYMLHKDMLTHITRNLLYSVPLFGLAPDGWVCPLHAAHCPVTRRERMWAGLRSLLGVCYCPHAELPSDDTPPPTLTKAPENPPLPPGRLKRLSEYCSSLKFSRGITENGTADVCGSRDGVGSEDVGAQGAVVGPPAGERESLQIESQSLRTNGPIPFPSVPPNSTVLIMGDNSAHDSTHTKDIQRWRTWSQAWNYLRDISRQPTLQNGGNCTARDAGEGEAGGGEPLNGEADISRHTQDPMSSDTPHGLWRAWNGSNHLRRTGIPASLGSGGGSPSVCQSATWFKLLSPILTPMQAMPLQNICLEGEVADRLWILEEGEVQVVKHARARYCKGERELDMWVGVSDPTEETQRANLRASPGKPVVLGHGTLLRLAIPECMYCLQTIRARTFCQLWVVRMEYLRPIFKRHPDFEERVMENLKVEMVEHLRLSCQPCQPWVDITFFLEKALKPELRTRVARRLQGLSWVGGETQLLLALRCIVRASWKKNVQQVVELLNRRSTLELQPSFIRGTAGVLRNRAITTSNLDADTLQMLERYRQKPGEEYTDVSPHGSFTARNSSQHSTHDGSQHSAQDRGQAVLEAREMGQAVLEARERGHAVWERTESSSMASETSTNTWAVSQLSPQGRVTSGEARESSPDEQNRYQPSSLGRVSRGKVKERIQISPPTSGTMEVSWGEAGLDATGSSLLEGSGCVALGEARECDVPIGAGAVTWWDWDTRRNIRPEGPGAAFRGERIEGGDSTHNVSSTIIDGSRLRRWRSVGNGERGVGMTDKRAPVAVSYPAGTSRDLTKDRALAEMRYPVGTSSKLGEASMKEKVEWDTTSEGEARREVKSVSGAILRRQLGTRTGREKASERAQDASMREKGGRDTLRECEAKGMCTDREEACTGREKGSKRAQDASMREKGGRDTPTEGEVKGMFTGRDEACAVREKSSKGFQHTPGSGEEGTVSWNGPSGNGRGDGRSEEREQGDNGGDISWEGIPVQVGGVDRNGLADRRGQQAERAGVGGGRMGKLNFRLQRRYRLQPRRSRGQTGAGVPHNAGCTDHV